MSKPRVTAAPFERTTGRAPKGFGNWAFAPSTTETARDNDVDWDRVEFFTGTFAEARDAARKAFAGQAEWIAVGG